MSGNAARAWSYGRRGRGVRFTLAGLGLLFGAGHRVAAVVVGTPLFAVGFVLQLREREEQG